MRWLECQACGLGYPIENTDVDEPCYCGGELEAVQCPCEQHCVMCGCGDFHACADGCHWVQDPLSDQPLCSTCLPQRIVALEALKQDLAVLEALDLVIAYHADDGETRYQPTPGGEAVHHAA